MLICPYYLKANYNEGSHVKIWTAWIFMSEGGTKLWKTDEDSISNKEMIEQYLAPNGFYGRVTCAKGGVLYYEVNPDTMNMCDFYIWTEFLASGNTPTSGIDIWRPFLWLGDKPGCDDEYLWRAEVKSAGKLAFLDDFWQVAKQP